VLVDLLRRSARSMLALVLGTSAIAVTLFARAPAPASAETLSFTPEVVSGFLGGPGSISAKLTVTGTEYGGHPPPVVGLTVTLPAGTTLSDTGHSTCPEKVLVEEHEPGKCPHDSMVGPHGTARAGVIFENEYAEEQLDVEVFYVPKGLSMFLYGHSPALIEKVAEAQIAAGAVHFEVPFIETVPGANYTSITEMTLPLGETTAQEESSHLTSGLTLPAECPPSGRLAWSAAWSSAATNETGEQTLQQSAETACPAESPLRKRQREEEQAEKKAQEEALARKKAEEEAVAKRHRAEASASIRVEKVKTTGSHVVVTLKLAEAGSVTVAAPGLKKVRKTLSAGIHRITLALTKYGRLARLEERGTKLIVSLKVDDRTVFETKRFRL
jgi:hypothetical protein